MKNALMSLILSAGSICMANDAPQLKFSLTEAEFCTFLPYGQAAHKDFDSAVTLTWSAPFTGVQVDEDGDGYDRDVECADDGTPYAAIKEARFQGNLTDAKGNVIPLELEYIGFGEDCLKLSLINQNDRPSSLQFTIEGTLTFVHYGEDDTVTLAPIALKPNETRRMGLYTVSLKVQTEEEEEEEYNDTEDSEDFDEADSDEDDAWEVEEEDNSCIIISAHDSEESRNFISRIYAISFSGTDKDAWERYQDDDGNKLTFDFTGPDSELRNGGELQLHVREGGTTYTVPFKQVIDLSKR